MGKHFYQNVLEKFQLLTFFVRKNIPILSEVDENEHEKSNGLFIAELAENSHVDVDFFSSLFGLSVSQTPYLKALEKHVPRITEFSHWFVSNNEETTDT